MGRARANRRRGDEEEPQGFAVEDLCQRSGVGGAGFMICKFGFMGLGLGLRVEGLGVWVKGLGMRVLGLGFGV